jgi:ribulose-5-phosphate 4-epimerase/fuculose-1-phosphate aldolase
MNTQLSAREDYYIPKPATVSEAKSQLVLANRVLANENIFDYLGHVSVRNPENKQVFLISRSRSPEQVTLDDILEVDLASKVLTQTTERPYSERVIHAAIYDARKDVNCIVHAHPKELVILSVTNIPVRMIHHLSTLFYKGVPVYDAYDFTSPNSTGMIVRSNEEALRVTQTLGECRGMLMRGHGCNVVGENIPQAVQAVIALRDNVAMQLAVQQLGPFKSIDTTEAKVASQAISEPKRGWNYWVSRAMEAMPDLQSQL